MGGLGKGARKLGKKVTKKVDPIGYKIFRKSGLEAEAEKNVDKYVWGIEDPVEIPEPPVMPDEDDEALRKARRRNTARQRRRSGRASTVLSQDTLG